MVNIVSGKCWLIVKLMVCGIHMWAVSQEMFKISALDRSFKNTNLRLQQYSQGDSVLIDFKMRNQMLSPIAEQTRAEEAYNCWVNNCMN